MPIRITGLNSGLDTESIISALVSSYNYKTDKYKKAQTKLSWKQDAWKTLNTKIYSLYSSVDEREERSVFCVSSQVVPRLLFLVAVTTRYTSSWACSVP